MEFEIKNLSQIIVNRENPVAFSNDDFRKTLDNALCERNSAYNAIYFGKSGFVAISPKLEEKLLQDPDLAHEIEDKINALGSDRNSIVVIDRSGEITQYSVKNDKRDIEREIAEAKETAKARLRRKARLDAYFKLLERGMIKRKLVEQENAKRFAGKKYRCGTTLDLIAKCLLREAM